MIRPAPPIIAAASQNRAAFIATGAISLAARAPSEKEPATQTEKASMARCPMA